MNLRQLKHRHEARLLRVAQQIAYSEAMHAEAHHLMYPDEDDWSDDEDDGWCCMHCGGEAYREVDDIWWDKCDQYGMGPCTSCRGTGERRHQWVF